MEASEIRKKFLSFFEARGHIVVPSSSLLPDDPSVLLTTAGVQQFKKYYTGEADSMRDFGSANVASLQKCFRTSDIDEVGDETHNTFFQMLGNFSFGYKPGSPKGGYFKKEAITYAHDFIVKELGLPISYVTIFKGGEGVARDEESRAIWHSLGIEDIREEGVEDVFWGPTGNAGPCGPTTEIYCKNASGQDVEIWNIVFNEYFCNGSREELLAGTATLTPLEKKGIDPVRRPRQGRGSLLRRLASNGVDTGMGLERLAMIAQGKKNIFETDLFAPFMELLPPEVATRHKRIIIDHLRASAFLLADGVRPSNKERGYILRRLMRRTFVYAYKYDIPAHIFDALIHDVVHEYGEWHPELLKENEIIREEFHKEESGFGATLEKGMKELEKIEKMDGAKAFNLYQSYGLSPEITFEIKPFNFEEFNRAKAAHLAVSGVGQEKKFGGHGLLLDTGELKAADEVELKIVTRLHTATHLLQAALRKVLGDEVRQRGSDITAVRTRFDFAFGRKLTREEIHDIEAIVNEAIRRDYMVEAKEMAYEEAISSGALHFFREKYPDRVKVYSVFDPVSGEVFSRELCGGPHVTHTGEIGRFRIMKEESSSAGVRRIRATVE